MKRRVFCLFLIMVVLLPSVPAVHAASFADVSDEDWYAGAVDFVVSRKLFNGTSAFSFSPDLFMTRAMLVTVLHRYAGTPASGGTGFSDVPSGQWYSSAISWASENGIVNGMGNGLFDPNGNVTREQTAAILYRFADSVGADISKTAPLSSFSDSTKVQSWAGTAMQWAVGSGLINGIGGCLQPQGNATRAQLATIFMRFIDPSTAPKRYFPYSLTVVHPELPVYYGPAARYTQAGTITDHGSYTIVGETFDEDGKLWGELQGSGTWINLYDALCESGKEREPLFCTNCGANHTYQRLTGELCEECYTRRYGVYCGCGQDITFQSSDLGGKCGNCYYQQPRVFCAGCGTDCTYHAFYLSGYCQSCYYKIISPNTYCTVCGADNTNNWISDPRYCDSCMPHNVFCPGCGHSWFTTGVGLEGFFCGKCGINFYPGA